MNLFTRLFNYFSRQKAVDDRTGGFQLRPNHGQGPYTAYYNNFIARKVEPAFHEFLRESIPIVDAAINRLVSLDGFIEVEGDSDALCTEIREWMDNVRVNDVQKGLQAYHQSLSNEAFEQGFGLGEFVASPRRNDIVGLRTADSKFIKFKRHSSGLHLFQKSDDDTDWRQLNPEPLMYFSIHNENQNPYGTPLMRSCEFVSKCLTTIQNSVLNVWERFGDPSFNITYKTSKRDGADHVKRRAQIEKEFNTAIRAKREGKSADFVRAIDKDSEIIIEVIGHDNQILEMEVPARHMLEQIVAKTGLPAWMLGMHWSTTERLSNAEAEIVLADVGTRQAAKLPIFTGLVGTMLMLRGRRWKQGDWRLKWRNMHLHDIVGQAQARFLNAQADMYYLQNASAAGIVLTREDLSIGNLGKAATGCGHKHGADAGVKIDADKMACSCKELVRSVKFPALDRIEADYEDALKSKWKEFLATVKMILGLELPKGAKDPDNLFELLPEDRARINAALKSWLDQFSPSTPESIVNWYYGQSVSAGYLMAASVMGSDQPLLNLAKNTEIFDMLRKAGFDRLKNNATRAIIEKILPEMEAFALAGAGPVETARRLDQLFGNANADWERLARSEMTLAAERAKKEEWQAWGVTTMAFAPASGACGLCASMGGDYPIDECPLPVSDTHPRCRCSTRLGESEIDN